MMMRSSPTHRRIKAGPELHCAANVFRQCHICPYMPWAGLALLTWRRPAGGLAPADAYVTAALGPVHAGLVALNRNAAGAAAVPASPAQVASDDRHAQELRAHNQLVEASDEGVAPLDGNRWRQCTGSVKGTVAACWR